MPTYWLTLNTNSYISAKTAVERILERGLTPIWTGLDVFPTNGLQVVSRRYIKARTMSGVYVDEKSNPAHRFLCTDKLYLNPFETPMQQSVEC